MSVDRQTESNRKRSQKASDGSIPPHNIAAEEALLGAAMLSKDALEVLATKTEPGDFYKPAHQTIATALRSAYEEGTGSDVVIIADIIGRTGDIESIGGAGSLISLQANTPATSNAPRYAQIIHDHATLRRLGAAARGVMENIATTPFDVHEAVEKAQQQFADVASQNGSRSFSSLDMPDMGDVLNGDIVMAEPTILSRTDGKALLYAGKMHVFQAESGIGKSWLALQTAVEVLGVGGSVVFLDYEDHVGSITQRLLALGATTDSIRERFQYVQPSGPMGNTERAELVALFARLNPDLVILDGVAEALSRDGYDEDRNSDVVKWIDTYPRWISGLGACVLMIDHVSKDKDKQGRHARGASHKLAAVDGVAYKVTLVHGFSRHRSGQIKLTIAKDRGGAVGSANEVAAVCRIEPMSAGEVVRVTIDPPPEVTAGTDKWKPTRLMERLSLELEGAASPMPPKLLLELVSATSKPSIVRDAFARLKVENYISTYRIGQNQFVRLVKPYRQNDPPLAPENEQQELTAEQRDELAERRARKENDGYRTDDGDPGPTEPSD